MKGRRALAKEMRRAAMLKSAARLFELQGYHQTTFDEIAADAQVGVATVYKYFDSKQGIVVALLQPDLDAIFERGERVAQRRHADPERGMVSLLSAYRDLGGRNWARRELLRLTAFPGIGNEGILTDLIHQAEARTQAQIRQLLQRSRNAGQLVPHLPLTDATAVVFALLNQHFAVYLADSTLSFSEVFRRLSRCVRLVMSGWRI